MNCEIGKFSERYQRKNRIIKKMKFLAKKTLFLCSFLVLMCV